MILFVSHVLPLAHTAGSLAVLNHGVPAGLGLSFLGVDASPPVPRARPRGFCTALSAKDPRSGVYCPDGWPALKLVKGLLADENEIAGFAADFPLGGQHV